MRLVVIVLILVFVAWPWWVGVCQIIGALSEGKWR